MKINLAEIPEEGKSFLWSQKTAELKDILKDFIGKNNYLVEFAIKPLNSKNFELIGNLQTSLPEECSRCGIDIILPIHQKFNEVLIPKQEQPRKSKYARVNHISDSPQSLSSEFAEYDLTMYFDMGEYLRETVGLAKPFQPVGPVDEGGNCLICHKNINLSQFGYDEEMPPDEPKNPFHVLKNMRLS